eukprot:1921027-Rhodomonas_salina.1
MDYKTINTLLGVMHDRCPLLRGRGAVGGIVAHGRILLVALLVRLAVHAWQPLPIEGLEFLEELLRVAADLAGAP